MNDLDLDRVMEVMCIAPTLRERARRNLANMPEDEVKEMYDRALIRREKIKKLLRPPQPYAGAPRRNQHG